MSENSELGTVGAGQPLAPPTFAPPIASPIETFAAPLLPSIDEPPTEVDVVDGPSPRRGRSRLLVSTLLVALLGTAVAVIAVKAGSSSSTNGYSLDAAAINAGAASNVEYEMTMQLGSLGSASITARQDIARHLMAMDMAIPGMSDKKVSAIVDVGNSKMYMDASAFKSMGAPVSTKWISIDFSKVPGMKDILAKAGAESGNPLDVAKLFAKATTKQDLGLETFRGEQVRHYRLTVDTAHALDWNPSLRKQLESMGATLPKQIDYDVWITKANELRRTKSDIAVMGQTVSVDIVFTKVDSIEPIAVPAAKDATDISDLMGALS
jgi:hypothetical protein